MSTSATPEHAVGNGIATAAELRLTLYVRHYCHLCEEMLAALEPLRSEFRFEVDAVDVDSDPALEERYGLLVPLLAHAESELCHYHFDNVKVRAYLTKIR